MSLAIQIILVIAAVAMIITVLCQKSKSAGLGAAYGDETETFGTKGREAYKDKKLQKITVYLAIVIAVLAIILMCLH